ncbi:MAG TPA: aminopeptidase P N-terminal domain-containing protein, partial [Terriglobales bacterium]|nr:aminopeptidase P N-terminal domain-containing protein [Terriglobales bacterium]
MSFRSLLVRLAICAVVLGLGLPLFAQYTDMAAVNELGGPAEFARRRAELAKQLKTGYLILFARKTLPEAVHYREDNDFFYYTGVSDPGAVLVMDVAKGSTTLFETEQAPRTKQVYGANVLSLSEEERKKLGFEVVLPIGVLDRLLAYGLMRNESQDLWLRLSFADKADGARPETGGDYSEEYAHPYGDPTPGDRAAI